VAIRIDENFEVNAPAERVWAFMIDPAQVVQCLPGAELLGTEDDKTFTGRIRVKVGPITAAYKGRARFEELDQQARRVRMTGEGQEAAGGGSARMTMTSSVEALDGGRARVTVGSEVDVVGKLVQFGRGMMEEVSRQIFRQFTECVRSRLETSADAAAVDNLATTAIDMPPRAATRASPQSTSAAPAPQSVEPVRALPLLWTAFVNWLRRLFGGRE
jgi:carbon monoxide dehydrogenase subunit G